jgi:hypothetical protein
MSEGEWGPWHAAPAGLAQFEKVTCEIETEGKLTPKQEAALIRFARDNGRSWKRELNLMWFDGRDANEPDGGYLRQIRNQFGPSWLLKYRLPKVLLT